MRIDGSVGEGRVIVEIPSARSSCDRIGAMTLTTSLLRR